MEDIQKVMENPFKREDFDVYEYWEKNRIVGKFGVPYLDKELGGISKSDLVLIGARSGCVDGDTEFFTGKGWKKISEYQDGDLVLQANLQTQKASLVKPLQYIKTRCDKWYIFKTKYGLDMKLSSEHNMIYKTCCGNYKKDTAENIYNRHINSKYGFGNTIPTSFDFGGKGIDLSDDEIKLMLAVIADGCFLKNRRSCFLHLKKERKKKELKIILDSVGIKYRWYDRKDGYTDISFIAPKREKVFLDYWYNCNKHQLKVVCDNVLKWDGNIDKKGRKRFFTTNKKSADFIQFAFAASGFRATISKADRVGRVRKVEDKEYKTKNIDYTVCVTKRKDIGFKSDTTKTCWIEKSDEYKYCFTVPEHCLVLRRNGKIFITGNSGKSSLAKIIFYANDKSKTALFSLENYQGDVEMSLLRQEYNLIAETFYNARQWQTGSGLNIEKDKLDLAMSMVNKKLDGAMIFGRVPPEEEKQAWTIETLTKKIIWCATHGIELIIIDHLDYLDRDNPNESDNSHITELMKAIRTAQETGAAVVAFSHLRKPQGRVDDLIVPNENEFIGSSNKVKQATQVVLFAPANEGDAQHGYGTWCCIRKNRNGGIKNQAAKLWFIPLTESYLDRYDLYSINYSGTKAVPLSDELWKESVERNFVIK